MRNPVYIFQAALYCEDCARVLMRRCDPEKAHLGSDAFPIGPYPDGGGEADSPQHCDACLAFLENPLTADGVAYVRDAIAAWPERGNLETLATWRDFYGMESDHA